jgi:hypothetical protein
VSSVVPPYTHSSQFVPLKAVGCLQNGAGLQLNNPMGGGHIGGSASISRIFAFEFIFEMAVVYESGVGGTCLDGTNCMQLE